MRDSTPKESLALAELREQVLFGGEWFDTPGVEFHNMRHRGLWWDADDPGARNRIEPIRALVVHHTAGEGDVEQVYRTLRNSKNRAGRPSPLSVHFIIDGGSIYQMADIATVTQHAGTANGWSVGVEICSRGTAPNLPAHSRPEYSDTAHGRRLDFLRFTSDEVRAAKALCRVFCELTGLPHTFPIEDGTSAMVRRGELSAKELRNWHGLLGHMHITSRKFDPSPHIMDDIQAACITGSP